MAEKKFCDMNGEERFTDLRERVNQYNMLQLPGQPQAMHMGSSYLLNDLWREVQRAPRRLELQDGREHLTVNYEFQSDKYPWCPAGFVPLKVTDPMAGDLLLQYAHRRREVDGEFSRDLIEALDYEGEKHD